MQNANHFTLGIRVANFTDINLTVKHQLDVGTQDVAAIVNKIRQHADLPYVFVVSQAQADLVGAVLSRLGAIRSPCYPYALFSIDHPDLRIDDADLPVVDLASADAAKIEDRIDAFATARLHFNNSKLKITSTTPIPPKVDVVIVGGGITGLYAAHRLQQRGLSFCVLEKEDQLGGIWSLYANATSRVNTSECAYRLIENKTRSNRDHSATREILEDLAQLAKPLQQKLYLQTEVKKIEKTRDRYLTRYNHAGATGSVQSKGVILAINDRVGTPRKIQWPNQALFNGQIVSGISDHTDGLDWRNKKVVVVGMGAFAIENTRTALEGGARHVTVVARRHGTVCPKIIDYLNFATPYDENFKHDKKSNIRNMMYWKKVYDLSGATQPECWMGKIKHSGHTISVSDIWFVGHFLNKIDTRPGAISEMTPEGVIIDGEDRIAADIVVNCVGFERNAASAKALCGYSEMYNNNYVDKDFMYLADAYIDDDAFNSFFGSSVLEMTKFYLEVFLKYFDNPQYDEMIGTDGIAKIPIENRNWSDYIAGAGALIHLIPELYDVARRQVSRRTDNFLEKHDLKTYIEENKREWVDLHAMLAGRPMTPDECLPYVFDKLLPANR